MILGVFWDDQNTPAVGEEEYLCDLLSPSKADFRLFKLCSFVSRLTFATFPLECAGYPSTLLILSNVHCFLISFK
jgi:hypothetical protein